MYNAAEIRKNREDAKTYKHLSAILFLWGALTAAICLISIAETQRMTRQSAEMSEQLARAKGEISILNDIIEMKEAGHVE